MSMSLLQSNIGGSATGGPTAAPWTLTSSAVGFSSTTTAGSLLVCVVYGRLSSTTSSVGAGQLAAITSGITWTEATLNSWTTTPGTTAGGLRILYRANAPSIAPGITTTATHNISGSGFTATMSVEFALYEFSGIATSSPVDVTRAVAQSTGTPTVGTMTTTKTDLVLVGFSGNSANATAGAGYILGINMGVATTGQLQYALNVPAGAQSTAFTPGSQTNFAGAAVGFKTLPILGFTQGDVFGA